MSVDTKGLVVTDSKDIAAVCTKIEGALMPLIRKAQLGRKGYVKVDFTLIPSIEMVVARFKYGLDNRTLHIHFSWDYDAREYGEHAIIMSLGYCGNSETIMRAVLEGLRDLGPTYIDVNDCDDEDYVLVNDPVDA